jgi:hypothetical protein
MTVTVYLPHPYQYDFMTLVQKMTYDDRLYHPPPYDASYILRHSNYVVPLCVCVCVGGGSPLSGLKRLKYF